MNKEDERRLTQAEARLDALTNRITGLEGRKEDRRVDSPDKEATKGKVGKKVSGKD